MAGATTAGVRVPDALMEAVRKKLGAPKDARVSDVVRQALAIVAEIDPATVPVRTYRPRRTSEGTAA